MAKSTISINTSCKGEKIVRFTSLRVISIKLFRAKCRRLGLRLIIYYTYHANNIRGERGGGGGGGRKLESVGSFSLHH